MALHLSMKGRLAVLAGLACWASARWPALAIGSNQVNQRALTSLYERDIGSLVTLQRIENSLLEVRFRAAGVLLDQLPVPGSLNHLREARAKEVAGLWAELEPRAAASFTQNEAAEAFGQLRQRWSLVDGTLAKLESGYAAKDKERPHGGARRRLAGAAQSAVKPLQALIPVTRKSAQTSYGAPSNRAARCWPSAWSPRWCNACSGWR